MRLDSAVTSAVFSPDGDTLYTAGRDKVINIWRLPTGTLVRTIPVYEAVESMAVLPSLAAASASLVPVAEEYRKEHAHEPHLLTGGDRGLIRVWNATTLKCVYTYTLDPDKQGTVWRSLFFGA